MKLSEAKRQNEQQQLTSAHLMRSPSDLQKWFITLNTHEGKRFFLTDDADEVIVDSDLEKLFELLKSLGFHMAKITF